MLTTAEKMIHHALSTYTYDAENRVAARDVELSGGLAGADEVEGGGARGGRWADGAPMFEKLRVSRLLPAEIRACTCRIASEAEPGPDQHQCLPPVSLRLRYGLGKGKTYATTPRGKRRNTSGS